MLTDNPVIVRNVQTQPALMCAQRKAAKMVPTEEDFIRANIASFGNDIGVITNRVTSMYEVRSHFDKESKEYKELSYRIQCGQQLQQNAIDKAKGIICKPMPKQWYDWHSVNQIEDEQKKSLYRSIIAEKKPYFMRYIYPAVNKQYNTYIKNTNRKAMREFQKDVSELQALPYCEQTEEQRAFLKYYHSRMPVGVGDCVMNKICRRFENEFDGYVGKQNAAVPFDYTVMKSGSVYSNSQFYAIKKLYEDYNKRLKDYAVFANYERVDSDDSSIEVTEMGESFVEKCSEVCSNEDCLCDIILDLCYLRNRTKKFAWSICGSNIVHNLLVKHDGIISYPVTNDDGDFEYCGEWFTTETTQIGGDIYNCSE